MQSLDEIAIIYLDSLGLSYKKMQQCLHILGEPKNLFDEKYHKKLAGIVESRDLERVVKLQSEKIEKYVLSDLEKYSIFAITIVSPLYPTNLKNISDPPFVLYTIGDIGVLSNKYRRLGIVGTRTPSNYGREVANSWTEDIARAGVVTVSGLSYGIDTCCAESTLKVGGKTIAVLAGGLDSIYPSQNANLAKKIVDSGLLISEYRPHVRPRQYSFIARNRIISGLSAGTLVVEAGIKSGATSTAMFAVEQGRDLFVVPGNITSPQSAGTNDLIREMPDCFTISSKEILQKFGISVTKKQKTQVALSSIGEQICNLLGLGEMYFDDICSKLNLSAQEVSSELTLLEIVGKVNKNSGNVYSLVNL